MPPFPGAVDDWPAVRSQWLQTVLRLRDDVIAEKRREAEADAEYERFKAEREQRRGR